MKPKFPCLISATLAFLLMVADARAYYDPGVQRWINRDPIAEDGGINLFNFVYNQPTSYADTDGKLPIIIPILIIIGGGTLYANAPGPDDPHYGGMPYAETAMDLFPGTRGTKIGCNVGKKLIGAADNVAESLGKTVATELSEKAAKELSEKVAKQMSKAGLPSGGKMPFKPKLKKNKRGDMEIEKVEVTQGPKKGQKGYVDEEGRIWIKDPAHSGYPTHWDVQIGGGADYCRVGFDGAPL